MKKWLIAPSCLPRPVRGRVKSTVVTAGLFVLLGALSAASLPGQAEAAELPPLKLSATKVHPGDTVIIQGRNWPSGRVLQAAVCGGGQQSVSSDCELAGTVTIGSFSGLVHGSLLISVPPAPCPCVIMVTEASPEGIERLPIDIEGAAPKVLFGRANKAQPTLIVSQVHVVALNSWTSWFGGAAPRELVLTVHNTSSHRLRPLVVARWLEGTDKYVITSPPPRLLAAGGTVRLVAPFALPQFSDGSFRVIGDVSGGAGQVEHFISTTSATPRGLYILALLLAVVVLLAIGAWLGGLRRDNADDLTAGLGIQEETVLPELTDSGVR
jgi:hypothetical protein